MSEYTISKQYDNSKTSELNIYIIIGNTQYDVTEVSGELKWSGSKGEAGRKVSFPIVDRDDGVSDRLKITKPKDLLGKGVMFSEDGEELFRGFIFDAEKDEKGNISVTAYDILIYTAQNNEEYLFTNKKASAISKRIFDDFNIPIGSIDDTGYIIPYRLFDGDTLYDMIMTSLKVTYDNTGEKFIMFAKKGKAYIKKKSEQVSQWVIAEGSNLTGYTICASIKDVRNKVKLKAETDESTITSVVEDTSNQKSYGMMQHYETISDKVAYAELKKRAGVILDKKKKPLDKLVLKDIIGISDVITGRAVYIYIKSEGIAKPYYVTSDTHTYLGGKHIMSIEVSETFDLPEIDVGYDSAEESGKTSGSSGSSSSSSSSSSKSNSSSGSSSSSFETITVTINTSGMYNGTVSFVAYNRSGTAKGRGSLSKKNVSHPISVNGHFVVTINADGGHSYVATLNGKSVVSPITIDKTSVLDVKWVR